MNIKHVFFIYILSFHFNVSAEDLSLCKKGWSNLKAGNYDTALNNFDKCIAEGNLKNDALTITYRNRGLALKFTGKYTEAIESHKKALSLNTIDPWVDHVNIGNVWSEQKEYKKALDEYDIAYKLKPDYHEAYYNRGIVLERLNKTEEAGQEFITAYINGLRSDLLIDRLKTYGLLEKAKQINKMNENTIPFIEDKNEAAGFINTQALFMVLVESNCENSKWKELKNNWADKNKKYLNSANIWTNTFLQLIKKREGVHAANIAKNSIVKSMEYNAKETIKDLYKSYNSDKTLMCSNIENMMKMGLYDFNEKIPMYDKINNLVLFVEKSSSR